MESPLRGRVPDGTRLIETFRVDPGGVVAHADRHLARMARGAAALGYPFDAGAARQAMSLAVDTATRCRLTLDAAGRFDLTTAPLPPTSVEWRVAIHPDRLQSDDPWLRHKTTQRALYDAARENLPADVDEVLFLNERDEVCEGTITNFFAELADGARVTPPLSSGLLPGILRETCLADGWQERVLTPADLSAARRIWMGNALRGLIPARIVPIA